MSRKTGSQASFDLAALCEEIRAHALELSGQEPDLELVGARLGDGLRDAGVGVPAATAWKAATVDLAADARRRLAILVHMLRESAAGPALGHYVKRLGGDPLRAFCGFSATEAKLLSLELLLKSPFRVEELARKWLHVLGAAVKGEAEADGRARLLRLDFGDVLKNLDAADRDRAARLKKVKELEERRLKEEQEAYQRSGRE